eukprot:13675896-Ditylum_brightwellii.AAC.1
MTRPLNCKTSVESTTHLKGVILKMHPLNTEDHDKCMSTGRTYGQKAKGEKYEQVLGDTAMHMSPVIVQESCNSLLLHYQCTPSDLLTHCNGCGKKFTLIHTLEFKAGRLIIVQQNEDSSTNQKADNNAPVHVFKTSKDKRSNLRGNLRICRLRQNKTNSIIDVQVTNSDTKSYHNCTIKKHLKVWEMEKKKK